jgi:hypothetical protein
MDNCPQCGAIVPRGAPACPECGSDEQTGWSERARRDELGLPDEEFDYDDFTAREFDGKTTAPRGGYWFWWLVSVALLSWLLWHYLPWH